MLIVEHQCICARVHRMACHHAAFSRT